MHFQSFLLSFYFYSPQLRPNLIAQVISFQQFISRADRIMYQHVFSSNLIFLQQFQPQNNQEIMQGQESGINKGGNSVLKI